MEPVEVAAADDLNLPMIPHLDHALEALGLPAAGVSAPLLIACALASVTITEIAKNAAPRPHGVDTARWQWTWRGVAVLIAGLCGAALSTLGRVALHEGAILGLAGGLAAPLLWRVAIPYLRGGRGK